MKYLILTLGCKSNQYESQAMRELLNAAGHREVDDPQGAEWLVVNTCGVTGRAVASCRNAIRRAVRANPHLRVAVAGCGVDLGEEWPELPSGPPLVVPNAQKKAIASLIAGDGTAIIENGRVDPDEFSLRISSFQGRTRAYCKIQDGCDNHCTYCAVPAARGPARSRSRLDVLDEALRLVEAGHREIVLTGINIGAYRDGKHDFADLVADLAGTSGLCRLRLGSVEPPEVTPRLLQAMRHPKVCPHLHIPLQSGSDATLAAMGRRYRSGDFVQTIGMVKESLRHPALTTDIIVGFPTEDDQAFAASSAVAEQCGFSRTHVFLFSPRLGTPAASMRPAAPDRVVEERKNLLLEQGKAAAARYRENCVGLEERVIIETKKRSTGAADRYVTVTVTGNHQAGTVVPVAVTGVSENGLKAVPLDSRSGMAASQTE